MIQPTMEMSHQGGAEAESLLRPEHRPVVMPNRSNGWDGEGEKAPFIRNEPVRLTPAWEGTNLPNDTLNLKGVGMDLPKDKWNLVYFTLLLHGLGTLTAWNMFITAKPYFVSYKLVGSRYADDFLVYVSIASQLPNLFFSWTNVFIKLGGNLTTRIVWALIAEVLIFVVTTILAMVDSSAWPGAFFWVTMLTVFMLNGFNAIFQNSVFGVAARLPPKYTGAVILGSNICGTLVVFLNWASDSFGESYRTSAIYYFIAGIFVLLICFDTYFALPLNRFYRYYETQQGQRLFPPASSGPAAPEQAPILSIARQAAMQLYNIWAIFFVSLAIFPAMLSDIKPSQPGFLGANFTRITCFLTFNVMAMIGNITAGFFAYPKPKYLWIFTTLRFLFIPFFLLCNYQNAGATRTLPVLINNDYIYWLGAAVFAWGSGHGSSLGMMYVSGEVPPEHSTQAGMIGGAMLITGILSGVVFSIACPFIISMRLWQSS